MYLSRDLISVPIIKFIRHNNYSQKKATHVHVRVHIHVHVYVHVPTVLVVIIRT